MSAGLVNLGSQTRAAAGLVRCTCVEGKESRVQIPSSRPILFFGLPWHDCRARMFTFARIVTLTLVIAWPAAPARAADNSMETVEVTASREKMRREIQTFVHQVTRLEGEFVGRWQEFVCPMVVGVSDAQAQFIQHRLIEVQNTVRKKQPKPGVECRPNLFVIITDEVDQVLADWKERDPGMFRWKSREGVSRSGGTGPVRTWHNAILAGADNEAINQVSGLNQITTLDQVSTGSRVNISKPGCPLQGRIEAGCWEHINAVVVLVDARATGKVNLAQLADFISVVSLSQIDLSADLGGIDSILRLFAQPRPDVPPAGLTEWDYAFLKGLYRVSYSPVNQQRDIAARMVRELAPR